MERRQEHLKDLALELRNRGVEIHFTARAGTNSETRFRDSGFTGEDVGVLVDGGPAEFTRAVVDLLADHGKRFAMGAGGHNLVKRMYSVKAMGNTVWIFCRRLGSA